MLSKEIEKKIKKRLPNCIVIIDNFSSEHYGHGAVGVHIAVKVFDKTFEGKSIADQHRIIYEALREEIKTNKIHALRIKTGVSEDG